MRGGAPATSWILPDSRWVKRLIATQQFDQARAYMDRTPVEQALTILKHRKVSALFTTPKLLEALAERRDRSRRV